MTNEDINKAIEVLSAHRDGKPIQWRFRSKDVVNPWNDAKGEPLFNFGQCDYRAKPEPREFWIVFPLGALCGTAYSEKPLTMGIHVREVL